MMSGAPPSNIIRIPPRQSAYVLEVEVQHGDPVVEVQLQALNGETALFDRIETLVAEDVVCEIVEPHPFAH